jgi:pheromone a factor receptor
VFFAQDARFTILEEYGCVLSIADTWVSIVIISVPPVLLELIAGFYGCLSIRAFYKRRSELDEFLSSHENFNSNRYIRLVCFSASDLFLGIPITVFYLCINVTTLVSFPGLTEEHYHFSQVFQVPAVVWRATTIDQFSLELDRWIIVWGAFAFFAIFGFTKESRDNYRAVLQSVVRVLMMITGMKRRPSSTEECVFFFFFSVVCLIHRIFLLE